VKELVENSIERWRVAIEIVLEDGGRKLVRVSDDGAGCQLMTFPLALAADGTSKIRKASDLVGVPLRLSWEALPAIASVSQFEIQTAAADARHVDKSHRSQIRQRSA